MVTELRVNAMRTAVWESVLGFLTAHPLLTMMILSDYFVNRVTRGGTSSKTPLPLPTHQSALLIVTRCQISSQLPQEK